MSPTGAAPISGTTLPMASTNRVSLAPRRRMTVRFDTPTLAATSSSDSVLVGPLREELERHRQHPAARPPRRVRPHAHPAGAAPGPGDSLALHVTCRDTKMWSARPEL